MNDYHSDVLAKDTGPLEPKQLSDYEIEVILQIEGRLEEVCHSELPKEPKKDALHYLTMPLNRSPRVLLLDGDRGTGKSSLLFTLGERWRWGIAESSSVKDAFITAYNERRSNLGMMPDFVRTLPLLDFDPLPPGVPLIAAILQAWRPLVEEYDQLSGLLDDCALEANTLTDDWHGLFQFAASAWTDTPGGRNLIEQILDREEQVRDWQRFREQWRSFVNKVLAAGKCLKGPHKLTGTTVFVSMIDDVDLQVERVRELLPALRMLYHPRVVFVVGAHRAHMLDMLELDILGKQNKLAYHTNESAESLTDLAKNDRWAIALTRSSFEKVFVERNRWDIKLLSSLDFLAFPGHSLTLPDASRLRAHADRTTEEPDQKFRNFVELLSQLTQKKQGITDVEKIANAGELILRFARQADKAGLPGVMPYRTAEQLRHYLFDPKPSAPLEVLAQLISSRDARAAVRGDIVDLPITGQLSALYRPTRTEATGSYSVVLSSRPDFLFEEIDKKPIRMSSESRRHNQYFNFTGALIAKALEESEFPLSAAGLAWETYLSLAWTEWPYLGTSFAWTRHEHPRPDKLLDQTEMWDKFIRIQIEHKEKLERYAFAWIFYQRLWSRDPAPESLNPLKISTSQQPLPWEQLLKFHRRNQQDWRERTLPLLARPELGFPLKVQAHLLQNLPSSPALKSELKRERRRLITDAVVALYVRKYNSLPKLPTDETVEEIVTRIDQVYSGAHSGNLWMEKIENSQASRKKPSRIKRTG